MAKKKDTKTMLIRDVPIHLWSEVVAYCQEQGLIRRDFLELAWHTLKQKQPQDDERAGLSEAKQTAKSISQKLGAYKELIALQKEIRDWQKPLALMETGFDAGRKSRMLADFQNMEAELMKKMDAILPEGEIETPPVEMPLSKPDSETTDERLERMMRTVREMTGLHSDSDSEECANKAEVLESKKTIEEENSIENPIDEFLIAGKEKDGPMVFGEKATPERKARIKEIGEELEKRAREKSSG